MSQSPLAPPPQTGQPIDGWLYLLWRRLTQAGQILWGSITPGTSADVAAVVTDETGSPGSLVFSANPTLAGVNVATGDCTFNVSSTGTMYIGDVSNKAAYTALASSTVTSLFIPTREGDTARNNVSLYIGAATATPIRWRFVKGRGGTSHGAVANGDAIFEIQAQGSDGTSFLAPALIKAVVSGAVSTGVVPVDLVLLTGTNSTPTEQARIASTGVVTLGGSSTAPALKVTPVASQARWIEVTGATSSGNPTLTPSGGNLAIAGTAEVSGNLVFTGTANRITGDFSTATIANRVMFQSSVTNGNTTLSMIPNGTATSSQFIVYNNSDPTNAGKCVFYIDNTIAIVSSDRQSASGTYLPLTFRAGGPEQARIATDGTFTAGGVNTAPALKVTPVASQARWVEVTGATSSANPQLATTAGELLLPQNIVLPKTSGKGIQVDTAAPTFGWRDIIGQIGVKTAGAADPTWSVYRGSIYGYTFNAATTEAFFVFHIPHDYVPGSDMFVHIHWSQNVVDTGGTAGVPGVIEWQFDISYADGHGTAGGAGDPFIAPITVTVTQQASTTQYAHMIAEVQFTNNGGTGGLIDSATIQVDGLLLVRAYRVKANPADTLNQAPFGHTCDIHYQSTNIGTKQKSPNFYV